MFDKNEKKKKRENLNPISVSCDKAGRLMLLCADGVYKRDAVSGEWSKMAHVMKPLEEKKKK